MLPAKKIKESLTRLKEKSIVDCRDASMLPAKKIKESLTRLREKSIVDCRDASMFPAKKKRVIDTSQRKINSCL